MNMENEQLNEHRLNNGTTEPVSRDQTSGVRTRGTGECLIFRFQPMTTRTGLATLPGWAKEILVRS